MSCYSMDVPTVIFLSFHLDIELTASVGEELRVQNQKRSSFHLAQLM